MLPLLNRLNKEKDIKQVMSIGRSLFSPYFHLKIRKNNLAHNRITVVVSTKFSKKAVLRNRIKRQVREIFRLNLDKILSGHDIVISVSNKAINQKYQDLERNIYFLLNKAKLLKDENTNS